MAVNYPASLDNGTSLPNPSTSSVPNNPSHAGLHDNENAAIIATQTKVGIGSSTPVNNTVLGGTGTGTSAWSTTVSNLTLASPTITNATLDADTISGHTTGNTGTIYGVAVTAGTIGGASLATSAITLGYTAITANVTSTTTPGRFDITALTATVTVPAGGRNVKITAFCPGVKTSGSAGNGVEVAIMEGSTCLGNSIFDEPVTTFGVGVCLVAYVAAPSAASHTYKVQGSQSGAGTYTFAAGTANPAAGSRGPAFILVELI